LYNTHHLSVAFNLQSFD